MQYMKSYSPFQQLKVSIALISLQNCVKQFCGTRTVKQNTVHELIRIKIMKIEKKRKIEWEEKLEREEIKRIGMRVYGR